MKGRQFLIRDDATIGSIPEHVRATSFSVECSRTFGDPQIWYALTYMFANAVVNRKHAPKSEPAAILAAKKTFDMLLLPVGFFYSELDMWSFCDHD